MSEKVIPMTMYESIGGEVKVFALPSMYNYLYSVLSLLNNRNHKDFVNWRLSVYSDMGLKQLALNSEDKRFFFEQFFFAYKLMNNVKFLSAQSDEVKFPFIQLGCMAFYYASYSLSGCFLYLHNKSVLGTHAKVYRYYNDVCKILTFPFNLTGRYRDGSLRDFDIIHGKNQYPVSFVHNKNALKKVNTSSFDYKSATVSYLMGSQKFYWECSQLLKEAKKEARKKEYINFKTKDARLIRDNYFAHLPDANYLSCLYRLRGKINYRDSIFSLYNLEKATKYNTFDKGTRLLEIMLEILKYFSLDIESYFKVSLGTAKFHEEMLSDMISRTTRYNHLFPEFQKKLFYA